MGRKGHERNECGCRTGLFSCLDRGVAGGGASLSTELLGGKPRVQAAWSAGQGRSEMMGRLARQIGLGCRLVSFAPQQVSAWRLPLVVELDDGQVGVVATLAADGSLSVRWSGGGGLHSTLTRDQLAARARTMAILRPVRAVPDVRVDQYIRPYQTHWFRSIVLGDLRPYGHVMLASLM